MGKDTLTSLFSRWDYQYFEIVKVKKKCNFKLDENCKLFL